MHTREMKIHHCFFNGTRQQHPRVSWQGSSLQQLHQNVYAVCASVESWILGELQFSN